MTQKYSSVTEYLVEGNSSELLTEDQRYMLLTEYFEEEYLNTLNEEELVDLYDIVEGIVMKAIGGIARRKAGEAWRGTTGALNRGGDRVIRKAKDYGKAFLRGTGKAVDLGTGTLARRAFQGVDKAKGAISKEIEAQKKKAGAANLGQGPGKGRKADKPHLAQYKAYKEKQAAKREKARNPGIVGKVFRELDKGFMGKHYKDPATDSHVESTVYDRIGDLLSEVDIPR